MLDNVSVMVYNGIIKGGNLFEITCKEQKEMGKYLIIYYRNGLFHSTAYGDNKTVEHYLKQGLTVAIFDDRKMAVDALNDYKKIITA